MLEKKIVFEDTEGKSVFLENKVLINMFFGLFHQDFAYDSTETYFKKVGVINKPVIFNFDLNFSKTDNPHSMIREVDDVDFVSEVLRTIKQYRIIGRDGVYIDTIRMDNIREGEYVLAHGEEPLFKITWGESGSWIYTPTSFAFYNKRGTLKHNPNLDIRPNQVEIELSVQNQKKEKILVKMYEQILKHYNNQNFKAL